MSCKTNCKKIIKRYKNNKPYFIKCPELDITIQICICGSTKIKHNSKYEEIVCEICGTVLDGITEYGLRGKIIYPWSDLTK